MAVPGGDGAGGRGGLYIYRAETPAPHYPHVNWLLAPHFSGRLTVNAVGHGSSDRQTLTPI